MITRLSRKNLKIVIDPEVVREIYISEGLDPKVADKYLTDGFATMADLTIMEENRITFHAYHTVSKWINNNKESLDLFIMGKDGMSFTYKRAKLTFLQALIERYIDLCTPKQRLEFNNQINNNNEEVSSNLL